MFLRLLLCYLRKADSDESGRPRLGVFLKRHRRTLSTTFYNPHAPGILDAEFPKTTRDKRTSHAFPNYTPITIAITQACDTMAS